MTPAILSVTIKYERDVVLARQRARQIAGLLGFDPQDQTRIATAVSEIARNAFSYGRGGKVAFQVEGVTPPQVLVVRVTDEGPGIEDVRRILEGRYRSSTGMGLGILGARPCPARSTSEGSPTSWRARSRRSRSRRSSSRTRSCCARSRSSGSARTSSPPSTRSS